jgi:hypothetical protein
MERHAVGSLCLSFTSALLAGCQNDEECGEGSADSVSGPPTLVAARFVEQKVVRLTFSEPLAPVDGVDPASFRLSWSWYYEGDPGYSSPYTSYYDPMLLFCLSSDFCPGEYTDVVELSCDPDDPSSLLLRVDAFSQHICNNISTFMEYYEDYTSPLLVHFDAGIGSITDLDGEPLASIAPEFVTAPDYYLTLDGNFPNYPMRIPIECP